MHRVLTSPLAVACAAAALTGCGVTNPYTAHPTARSRTADGPARPAPAPATTVVGGGVRALLIRYTLLSIDWSSRTLASRQRQLAGLAVAGARAQALQTAATYGWDSSLRRSRVANRGQITSLSPGQGPRAGWWVITTQETTSGSGDYEHLPVQAHIYDAQLSHTPDGWRISTWSPQS